MSNSVVSSDTVQSGVMMGKRTEKSVRGILLGLTGASIFLGVILLVVGAVMVSGYSVFLDFITGRYLESAVFILVMGIIVICVSACGKFSAKRKKEKKLFFTLLNIRDKLQYTILQLLVSKVDTFALNNLRCNLFLLPNDIDLVLVLFPDIAILENAIQRKVYRFYICHFIGFPNSSPQSEHNLYMFSCESRSLHDNVCRSVCLSVCLCETSFNNR